MGRLLSLKYNEGTFMIVLFSLIGLGGSIVNVNKERSLTVTFKLWKMHLFYTIGWIE